MFKFMIPLPTDICNPNGDGCGFRAFQDVQNKLFITTANLKATLT
jgi:hypothetical protein